MKKIEKLVKVCGILNNFVAEHKGVLEVKDVKEIEAVQKRLLEFSSKTLTSDDSTAAARARKDDSFVRLQKAITETKKQYEIVKVRDGKQIVIPAVSSALFNPSRIGSLAQKYIKAGKAAGDDPVVKKSLANLQKVADEYADDSGDTTQNVFDTRTLKRGVEFELDEINTKLNGFAAYVAAHVSRADRAELYSRLVRARPVKHGRKDGDGNAETPASVQSMAAASTALTQGAGTQQSEAHA